MKIKSYYISAIAAALLATASVFAADGKISPALDTIAAESEMIKSGVIGESVSFTAKDFEAAAGIMPASVTITSLPSEEDGELRLGVSNVSVGQTIAASNLDLLRFIPTENTSEASFKYTFDRSYSISCSIKLLEEENQIPSGNSNMRAITQQDVSYFGTLEGKDPEGDELKYELVDFPTLGIVSLTNSSDGSFKYTPYSGVRGVDTFSYRITDEYGNYSDVCEASVKIIPRSCDVVLEDMEENVSYNAALTMISCGAMKVINENGKSYFDPDEGISRADFLKTMMISLGTGKLSPIKTVFTDDSDINDEYSGYIAAAYKLGIIKGEKTASGHYFRPNDIITHAEASVMLNRVLGVTAGDVSEVFAPLDNIPAWAYSDINALNSCGIIKNVSTAAYNDIITRGAAAQILYCAKTYLDE